MCAQVHKKYVNDSRRLPLNANFPFLWIMFTLCEMNLHWINESHWLSCKHQIPSGSTTVSHQCYRKSSALPFMQNQFESGSMCCFNLHCCLVKLMIVLHAVNSISSLSFTISRKWAGLGINGFHWCRGTFLVLSSNGLWWWMCSKCTCNKSTKYLTLHIFRYFLHGMLHRADHWLQKNSQTASDKSACGKLIQGEDCLDVRW